MARFSRRLDDLGKSLAARWATRIPGTATCIVLACIVLVPVSTPENKKGSEQFFTAVCKQFRTHK